MMATDPAKRYPSAAQAGRELTRWAEGCDLPALLERAELAYEPSEMAGLDQATTVDYLKSALADTSIDHEGSGSRHALDRRQSLARFSKGAKTLAADCCGWRCNPARARSDAVPATFTANGHQA